MWTDNKEAVQDELARVVGAMRIQQLKVSAKGDESTVPFSSDARHGKLIAGRAVGMLPITPDWGKDLVLGSQMKVAFRDGYYEFLEQQGPDGRHGVFRRGESFDTAVMIPRDFPARVQEDIDFVMDKIISPPFENSPGGTMERFLLAVARAMAGHYDIDVMIENPDGTITFVYQFYNGGTCLSECIEHGLARLKKQQS